jgi:hypothetical protein
LPKQTEKLVKVHFQNQRREEHRTHRVLDMGFLLCVGAAVVPAGPTAAVRGQEVDHGQHHTTVHIPIGSLVEALR